MSAFRLLMMSTALILATTSIVKSQSSDPDWLDALRTQLAFDQNCEVEYFLNVRESESALGVTYSARVQCRDGRQFDAIRAGSEPDFRLEACGSAICGLRPNEVDRT